MSHETYKPIDLSSLDRICTRLEEPLHAYKKNPDDPFILDAVVKRFEPTYELSIRSLRRYLLDYSSSTSEVEALTFEEMIRLGDELGLLAHSWAEWKLYREARNQTTHTYLEEKAKEIAADADKFLIEAQYLIDNSKEEGWTQWLAQV